MLADIALFRLIADNVAVGGVTALFTVPHLPEQSETSLCGSLPLQLEFLTALLTSPSDPFETEKLETFGLDVRLSVPLLSLELLKVSLIRRRNYAARTLNCSLRERAFVEANRPCCLRIM